MVFLRADRVFLIYHLHKRFTLIRRHEGGGRPKSLPSTPAKLQTFILKILGACTGVPLLEIAHIQDKGSPEILDHLLDEGPVNGYF
jgi:hypothetical protein